MEPTAAAGNLLEIMDLARTLRQEQLFIQHEQAAFAQLTGALETNASTITKLAYICAQQRQNLHDLLLDRTDHDPLVCCRRASAYDNAPFMDAKQVLPYEHALAYEDLFNYLYNAPYLLALSLATAERLSLLAPAHLGQIVNTIATGLYGNAINTKDVELLLKLLRELIELQLLNAEQPRRLLRTNGSAFARLYQHLVESLFSARIFLTAALHEPLMAVLSEHEALLDVDPHKLLQVLTPRERQRRFGEDDTSAAYQRNVARFHAQTLSKLHAHAQAFVRSLQQSWALFPSSLRWLLQTLGQQLRQTQRHSDHEIRQLLSDLVFTHFICPAIVSADLLGIIDVNVSEQMRQNLNQIVQLLQLLALSDSTSELTQLMELLLLGQTGEDVVAILPQQSDFERAQLAINRRELQQFADFFRLLASRDEYDVSVEERQRLRRILARIPKQETIVVAATATADAAAASPEKNGKRPNKGLMRLGKATKKKLAKGMSFTTTTTTNSNNNNNTVPPAAADLPNGSNGQVNGDLEPCSSSHSGSNTSLSSCGGGGGAAPPPIPEPDAPDGDEPVLMFSIYNAAAKSKLKPLTEEDLLKMNCIGQDCSNGPVAVATAAASSNADDVSSLEAMRQPINDDASIGNSDNLEAISEAAHSANHSVASSLDLEEQQERDVHDAENDDNLSDMVSANVSGRGTPNISGRDTPSSQVTDGDGAGGELAHHVVRPTPQMQKMLLSKARSDIEDKFCKFELKKFEGDENVSIISDTWSTDVLASDSENTLDASSEQHRDRERERERNFSTPLIPSAVVLPGDNNNFVVEALARAAGGGAPVLDASDQRSESNWSTDVLASDSEKLAEMDTDDNVSITAKSDITAPSALAVVLDDDGEQTPGSSGDGDVVDVDGDADNNGNGNGSASERSQEDSAFFDAVNSYEDAHHYQAASSLARSSVRTSYHGLGGGDSGDSSFQQQYKCSGAEGRKSTPLMGTACMRRQTSAESSISNQSLNLEEPTATTSNHHHHHHHHHHHKKKKQQSHHDLIDFSDYSEDKEDPPGIVQQLLEQFGDEHQLRGGVQHRRISMEQRTASVDGRRNGILAGATERRHQSLNYENHEIMLQTLAKTDDDKQQELQLLCARAQQLQLHDVEVEAEAEAEDGAAANLTPTKPNKATGAIPKSISFDASADKEKHNTRNSQQRGEQRDQSAGILNKLKQGIFKNRRSNSTKSSAAQTQRLPPPPAPATTTTNNNNNNPIEPNRSVSFDPSGACVGFGAHYCDSSEDILAKYRRKVSSSSEATNSDSTGNGHHSLPSAHGQAINGGKLPGVVFSSVKQKLRTVLSKTDLHSGDFRQTTLRPLDDATPLQTYLQIQLAQCTSLQRLPQISHVSEALRCLAQLERPQHAQLLLELQHDLQRRQSYLQYLLVHRQQLLLRSEQLEQLEDRLRGEARSCQRCLLQSLVRLYLGRQQTKLQAFQTEFALLSVSDERLELIEEFVESLLQELREGGLQDDWQREAARVAIERLLLEQIYEQVMFPNDDADLSRDGVLAAHIGKLQRFVHPAHPALCIAQEYLGEAPWTFAQQQLCHMAAYKTPREKLHCIINCISSIMSLLRMSSSRVPAADDVLPVLIYVVIMANPPYLLSTVEYISCFLGKKLDGEDEFYWTLFGSVVKFIKTMDYRD